MSPTTPLVNVMNVEIKCTMLTEQNVWEVLSLRIAQNTGRPKIDADNVKPDFWCHTKTRAECARTVKKRQEMNACDARKEKNTACFQPSRVQLTVDDSQDTTRSV